MSQRVPAVELLSIGDELLLGDIVDTNAPWLSRRLGELGVRVARRATVGDDEEDIVRAVREALTGPAPSSAPAGSARPRRP